MAQTKRILASIFAVLFASVVVCGLSLLGNQSKPQLALAADIETMMTEVEPANELAGTIQFIYVDSSRLSQGATQFIAVALEDEGATLESMTLSYRTSDGCRYELVATNLVANAASFEFSIGNEFVDGRYELVTLDYQVQGQHTRLELSDELAYNYGFDVGEGDAVEPLAVKDGANTASQAGEVIAYAIDGGTGLLAAHSSIAQALKDVATDSDSVVVLGEGGSVTVALDPGHGLDPSTGNWDPGAMANGLVEADLNGAIANACREALEQHPELTVIMVPRYRYLNDRVDWAARNGADVYVSLHNNAGDAEVRGFEVYVPNESSFNYASHVVGYALGEKVRSHLKSLGLIDRGIRYRDSDIYVYPDGHLQDYYTAIERSREHGFPGIIVEHAFVTDGQDADFLRNDDNLRRLGVADAEAIYQQFVASPGSEATSSPAASPLVPNGCYRIAMKANPTMVLDVGGASLDEGANVVLWNDAQSPNQLFYFTSLEDGSYSVINKNSGKALAVPADGSYNRANVEQQSYQGAAHQRWRIVDTGTPCYKLVNVGTGLLLNIEGNNTSPGTNVVTWEDGEVDEEYFHLIPEGSNLAGQTVKNGSYRIAMASDDNCVLEIANASKDERANVQIWGDEQSAHQLFRFNYLGDGSYSIINYGSGKALTASSGDAGANVVQESYRGDPNQRWYVIDRGNGCYAIVSCLSDRYLNVVENRTEPGTNVLIWDDNASPEERFVLKRYTTPIMGASQSNVDQMVRCYQNSGYSYPAETYGDRGAPSVRDFCQILYDEAGAEGVRAEVLFNQIMKETRWLNFGGVVKPDQCNFGGLGATDASISGAQFADVREGLRAQVQHLKAYASTSPLVHSCVDPRFDLVDRGVAPYLEDLDGRWAVPGDGYGEDISFMTATLLRS